MSLIQVTNLKKYFRTTSNDVRAVDDVSLDIENGDFCLIMGQSGSGKSTLLSVLGGLSFPTSGKVIIDDIDIYNLSGDQLADFRSEYLGFVFQSFQLIPYLTVIENVMIPFITKEYSAAEQLNKAMEILKRVELINKAERLPDALSGGEQQRVAVARALVNDPLIILADEPTGNLDTKTGKGIMKLLKELNEEGKTVITVSHNSEFETYANKSVYLSDGKIDSLQESVIMTK